VLEDFAGPSAFANDGERVVVGQRLMQSGSDIFLGWLRVDEGTERQRDYYGRQLKDWKASAEIEQMDPESMAVYGRMCGWTLARAHARTGNRIAIAAYLGGGDRFDQAILAFSEAYAEQNDREYGALRAAVGSGRVVAETGVSRRQRRPCNRQSLPSRKRNGSSRSARSGSALVALALGLGLRAWVVRPRVRPRRRATSACAFSRCTAAIRRNTAWIRSRPELDGRLRQPSNQLSASPSTGRGHRPRARPSGRTSSSTAPSRPHGTVGSCDTSPGAASNHCTRTEVTMISAVLMVRRLVAALRVALREEDFERVLTAGLLLIVIGTLAYSIGGGWSIVDGLYVAVATLTTSSILDPALTITDPWLKVFTAGYVLVGIGHPGRTRSAARNGLHDGTSGAGGRQGSGDERHFRSRPSRRRDLSRECRVRRKRRLRHKRVHRSPKRSLTQASACRAERPLTQLCAASA
jgi:hypothetical protein